MTFRQFLKVGLVPLGFLVPVTAAYAADAGNPDDIIVTAEKANRSLRETSASVVVSTAEDIERRAGIYSSNELLDRIPNMLSIETGNDLPAVRGIDGTGPSGGVTAFFAGARPRLNYQIDGRTLNYNEAVFADTSLWDIDQIEVFRGPQSLLSGRNAIAGVVAVKTVDPTFDWQGAARAIIGNREERVLSGAIGGPIVDDLLAFRVSGNWQREQSFLDFTGYPGVDNPGRFGNTNVRGKLLLTPSAGVRSVLALSYLNAREPQSSWIFEPFSAQVATSPNQPVFRARTKAAISDTTVDLTDSLSLQLYLSATDFEIDRFAVPGTGASTVDGKEYVVQPFLRYRQVDGRFNAFIAAYVFRAHQNETIDFLGGGAYRDETDTTAVFGEATFRPIAPLSVTVGARYEEEKRYRVGVTGGFLATNFIETYREFLPKATVALDVSRDVTVGVSASRGYNAGGAGITLDPPFLDYTFKPEYVWDYEGFVRGNLARNLSLNANIFYNRYKDLQLPFFITPLSTVIRNAEKASTYGAEATLSWRPSKRNEVFFSGGLLKTRIDRYEDPSVVGNDLPRAPSFSFTAGFSFSPDDRFELGADVRYTNAYYSDFLNDARGRISPYALVNGKVAYNLGPARLFFTVRNLLNSNHAIQVFAQPAPFPITA